MVFLEKFTLRTKLFLSFTLAVLLTFGLASYILFSLFYTNMKDNADHNLTNTSNMIFNMIDLTVSSSLEKYLQSSTEISCQNINDIYIRYTNGEISEKEAKASAKQFLLNQRQTANSYLFAMDTSLKIIVHPDSNLLGKNIYAIESINRTQKTFGNYIEYTLDIDGNPKRKALYMQLFKPWNWIIAATTERKESQRLINVENIKDKLGNIDLGEHGYVLILDTLGQIIFHPHYTKIPEQQNPQAVSKIQKMIKSKTNGTIYYKWKDPGKQESKNKIIKYTYMDDLSWIVAVSIYSDEIYKPLDRMLNIIVLTAVFSILLLLYMSAKYTNYILEPIRLLNNKFKQVAQKDLSVRMDYFKKDELGELSKHFNLFMDQLNDYYSNLTKQINERIQVEETLKEYQEDLEQKVVRRTKELVNLNDKLKIEIEFRKEITENLKESEEQYKALFENTDNVIFLIYKNRIEIANGSFVNKFVTDNMIDLKSVNFLEFFEPKVRESFSHAFADMQNNQSKSTTFEFKSKDNTGIEKYFEANIITVHYKASLAFQVSIADITSKIFMEGRLRQTQKMESIGQLAAGIAHEINTSMQFIGDNNSFLISVLDDIFEYIETMKRIIQQICPEKMLDIEKYEEEFDIPFLKQETPEALFRTQNGIKRISKIVGAMKNFAHPSGNEKKLADINQGIDVTITISKNEWKYCAEIKTYYDTDLPFVMCSMDEINQVLLNMIVNAAHAIEEKQKQSGNTDKGTISISTSKENNFIKISISDTGNGISEENIYKIFDPFFTTKEVGKGTGQGLSIAYDIIVNKHFGNIDIKSEVGIGSTFIISLPTM